MPSHFVLRDGYVDVYATPAEVEAMAAEVVTLSLTGRTLGSLRTFFDAQGHRPSEGHWVALYAIAGTMQAMLEGRCPPKVHLSPCDPGVGKSRTVIHFARELAADPAYRDAGMIVSVFTIAEARAMAAALQDIRGSLCVLTSDEEANAMGGALANEAQVLLTTQSRLGKLTTDRLFGSVSAFHYQGAARVCRVWDESVLPGSVVVAGADDVMRMAAGLRRFSPALVATLYAFAAELLTADDGAAIDVPDFDAAGGRTLDDLVDYLVETGTPARTEDRTTALTLRHVATRRVRVRRDGLSGSALLTFREEMAPDLLPMLVLDASGRVRATYPLWQESRNAIVTLPAAVRDYGPLKVRVWKTSGAKSGWARNGDRLAAGIVNTILAKPAEDWLVVVHKPNPITGDPEKAITAKLPAEVRARVAFTTWGKHLGLNAWADVPNVILAGTIFYPASHTTALHHLCAGIPVVDGLADRAEITRTEMGEHRHLLLQAICRGRARRSDGDRCQPMTAYVIASPRSGIAAQMPDVFPGCTVETWEPVPVEAKGKLAEAIGWLKEAFKGGRSEVTYAEVYGAVGILKAHFSARVAKTDAWRATIDALGAEVVRGARGALTVRVLPAEV